MAILSGIARLLIEEHQKQPFTGRLLQLGRQEIMFKRADLRRVMQLCGMPTNRLADGPPSLTDVEFFGIFAFDEIEVSDVSTDMKAEVVHDLNSADVAERYRRRFDVIFDGGTMEHVFHAPNVLVAIHGFLAEGGRVIHNTPASNSIDHGFYSFSPCLYHEYYTANAYDISTAYLLDYGTRYLPIRMTAFPYKPPLRRSWLDARRTGHVHYNFFVARKTPKSTAGLVPQQSFYEGVWAEASGSAQTADGVNAAGGVVSQLKALIKSSPIINGLLRRHGLPLIRLHDTWSARRALRRIARRIEV